MTTRRFAKEAADPATGNRHRLMPHEEGAKRCQDRRALSDTEAAMRREADDLNERFNAFVREHGERHLRVARPRRPPAQQ